MAATLRPFCLKSCRANGGGAAEAAPAAAFGGGAAAAAASGGASGGGAAADCSAAERVVKFAAEDPREAPEEGRAACLEPSDAEGEDAEADLAYEDGSSYRGQLLGGRRHGRGSWTADQRSYCGQWRSDQRDGLGLQVWDDGRTKRTYKGQFKAGMFHGHGRMEWHSPEGMMLYVGQYENDLKHGAGRYDWPDGRVYDGQWRYGFRWGQATFTTPEGLQRPSFWREDVLEQWVVEADDGVVVEEAEQEELSLREPMPLALAQVHGADEVRSAEQMRAVKADADAGVGEAAEQEGLQLHGSSHVVFTQAQPIAI